MSATAAARLSACAWMMRVSRCATSGRGKQVIQHQPLTDGIDRVGDVVELAGQGPDVLEAERGNEIAREGGEDLVRDLVATMLQVPQSWDGLVRTLLPGDEVASAAARPRPHSSPPRERR